MRLFKGEKIFNGAVLLTWTILYQCSFTISNEKLPDNLRPVEYDVELFTNIDAGAEDSKFWGRVQINMRCIKATNSIKMHKESLIVSEDGIKVWHVESENDIPVIQEFYENGQYIIMLAHSLEQGELYAVQIKFSSPPENNSGFYIINNQSRPIAYSLTNKYAARNIFPCMDQIDMKASFKIKLGHNRNMIALTNSKSFEETIVINQPGWILEEFVPLQNTVSTYSINFALSSLLQCTESEVRFVENIHVQICLDDFRTRNYIIRIVCRMFYFMDVYLSIPYPLEKFDFIIESNGYSDITEGYGLVNTGLEYISKVMEKVDYSFNNRFKYEGISRLCYIVSHQWFGHIITMEWNENWFYDGLNYFIQWECSAHIYRKFYNKQFPDFEWDSISSFLQILKREEIGEWISIPNESSNWTTNSDPVDVQKKVAHLIRMIRFFLGNTLFEVCLRSYLETYQFQNTNLKNFWDFFTTCTASRRGEDIHLTSSSYMSFFELNRESLLDDLDMETLMQPWIRQDEYPLIIVKRDYEIGTVSVRQVPFTILARDTEETERSQNKCWKIPLSFRSSERSAGVELRRWLPCQVEISLESINYDENNWLLVNMDLNVLSRVDYDEENWIRIKNLFLGNLDQSGISIPTRVRIVSDMFAMAKVGRLSYRIVFDTMKYLKKEEHYAVWQVAMEEFHEIRLLWLGTDMKLHKQFKKYMRDFLHPLFRERIKSKDFIFFAKSLTTKLNILIVEEACTFAVKKCKQTSSKIVNKEPDFQDTSVNKIPYSINKVIHCQKAKRSSSHWTHLWNQFTSMSLSEEIKDGILEALGCTRKHEFLQKALDDSLNSEAFTIIDTLKIFRGISSNIHGYDIMLNFLMTSYNKIVQKAAGATAYVLQYWTILLNVTTNMDNLNTIIAFSSSQNMDSSNTSPIGKSTKIAKKNINWLKNNTEIIKKIISERH